MKKSCVVLGLMLLSFSLIVPCNSVATTPSITPPPTSPERTPLKPVLPLFFHLLDSPLTVIPGIVTSEIMNKTLIRYPEPKEDTRSFGAGESSIYEFYLWPLLTDDLNISRAWTAVVCWLKANATVRINRVIVSIFDVESAENQTLISGNTFYNITVFEKEMLYIFVIPMFEILIFPPPIYTIKANHSIKAEIKFERPTSDIKLTMLLDGFPYNSFLVLMISRVIIMDILVKLCTQWPYALPKMRAEMMKTLVEICKLWPNVPAK